MHIQKHTYFLLKRPTPKQNPLSQIYFNLKETHINLPVT